LLTGSPNGGLRVKQTFAVPMMNGLNWVVICLAGLADANGSYPSAIDRNRTDRYRPLSGRRSGQEIK
jgi:hypothetical protein